LLALARNEPGGDRNENFAPVDLNQLAQEVTLNWVPMALEKNIDLGFESGPDGMLLNGDANSLQELLNNLIDNAIRYTAPDGHITVGVRMKQGHVLLCVEDNGPGIAAEHRERVFERFYRILGSGESGSGLGLSIVAEIARRHSAKLHLGSGNQGIGTRICVEFPAQRTTR